MTWFQDDHLHFGVGVEDTFVPQTREGERAIDEYELTEHYTHWHTDLALATEVGATFVRWGIPWYRVNPAPGRYDWDWLDRVIARFDELSLRPIIDLLHYGTPLWLEGEFANRDYPRLVAEYGAAVAERYADRVVDYTPINEPMVHARFCGEHGYWPPYLSGQQGLLTMAAAVAEGFVLTQRAITDVLGDRAIFTHVDASGRAVGGPEHAEQIETLRAQSFLVEDLVTGRVTEGHPLLTMLQAAGVDDVRLSWFADHAVHPDIMGVNYYPRHSTMVLTDDPGDHRPFADSIPPHDAGVEGLEEVLVAYEERYGAPVALTETCVTGSVQERLDWLDASVARVRVLRDRGHRIVGYTWWPLFDMYEWTYRHSSKPRSEHLLTMGLWNLVESPTGLLRERNPVADRFAEHARGETVSG